MCFPGAVSRTPCAPCTAAPRAKRMLPSAFQFHEPWLVSHSPKAIRLRDLVDGSSDYALSVSRRCRDCALHHSSYALSIASNFGCEYTLSDNCWISARVTRCGPGSLPVASLKEKLAWW